MQNALSSWQDISVSWFHGLRQVSISEIYLHISNRRRWLVSAAFPHSGLPYSSRIFTPSGQSSPTRAFLLPVRPTLSHSGLVFPIKPSFAQSDLPSPSGANLIVPVGPVGPTFIFDSDVPSPSLASRSWWLRPRAETLPPGVLCTLTYLLPVWPAGPDDWGQWQRLCHRGSCVVQLKAQKFLHGLPGLALLLLKWRQQVQEPLQVTHVSVYPDKVQLQQFNLKFAE